MRRGPKGRIGLVTIKETSDKTVTPPLQPFIERGGEGSGQESSVEYLDTFLPAKSLTHTQPYISK